jgi:hypothetical protein
MPIWHFVSKLVRKMVRITEPQAAYLEGEAERLGISETEMLRRLIDEARGARLETAAARRPSRGGARKSTRA